MRFKELFDEISQQTTKTMCGYMTKRLFWPIFDLNSGGNIKPRILPPEFKSKIGSKEPENRLKLNRK
jgi:phage gp29-like protein